MLICFFCLMHSFPVCAYRVNYESNMYYLFICILNGLGRKFPYIVSVMSGLFLSCFNLCNRTFSHTVAGKNSNS